MNGNELENMGNPEDSLRAKLCAVILGEASDAERIEVEAALANSAELRAERARLEATIGLVSTALKEDGGAANELSPQSQAALSAAVAKRARPVAWHRTNGFRIAASFALFVGVVSIWRASISSDAKSTASLNSKSIDGFVASAPAKKSALGKEAAEPESRKDADNAPAAAERPAIEPALAETAAPTQQPEQVARLDFSGNPGDLKGGDIAKLDDQTRGQFIYDLSTAASKPAQGKSLGLQVQEQLEAQKGLRPAHDQVEALRGLGYLDGASGSSSMGVGPGTKKEADARRSNIVVTKGPDGHITYSGPAGSPAPSGPAIPAPPSGPATREFSDAFAQSARRAGGGGKAGAPTAAVPPGLAKSEGKAKDGGEVRQLKELGYVDGNDKDDVVLEGFEVPMYRDVNGRTEDDHTIAPDWHARFDRMQRTCWPRPNEKPRDMFFRYWGDNPFEITAFDKLSTFSVDVDTASYTVARNLLLTGNLPPKEAIRTEEFVNYFKGDVPAPREGTFNVATELAPSLFGDSPDEWMLRVALRGREVQKNERMPLTLTFIIDVSGSMKENDRLELVKHALRLLVAQLDARDSISIVKFSNDASLILPMTSAAQRDLIESAINPLQPDGSTNTEAGLRMGYAQAVAALTRGANNRVVLLTDGVANVGVTDPNALSAMVENQRKTGIYLNTVGVGMNNHNDNLLEQLADKGDGVCNYVDDAQEVRHALVDNFTSAFETIARDVKIQVEFDAAQVERYRLLGYENRAIADADFRNEKVDAGEVGAGHQVVALYEIVRTHASGDGPLATVRVRWKQPYKNGVADSTSDVATEIAQPVFSKNAAGSFNATSAGYRRAVLVAQFAEFLRRSIHARNDSVDRLVDEARKLAPELKDPMFDEFVKLTETSRALVLAELARRDWFDRCGDELRRRCYLQAQIDDLQRRLNREPKLDDLQRDTYDLQRQLDALRSHLETLQGQGDEETLRRLQAENIELQRRMIELLSKDRVSDGK